MFHEYTHSDNAAGLGAFRQAGWTGIVADVIRRHGMVTSIDGIIRRLSDAKRDEVST